MLVARDVEVSVHGGVKILGPISLDVAPGSLVALMGASGSGKSTLVRVLAGLTEPTAGDATWLEQPTTAAVQALGYVPQRESIHDRLTVREALGYAAYLRLDASAPIAERVSDVLHELDLVEQSDTLVRNLSGGERRRAACGLELVGDPHVLLLDEPTSGLDAVLERRLMQLFRRLADHGRAVLVVTHATASLDLCDEVVVMSRGVAAYRGAPEGARMHLAALAADSGMPDRRAVPAGSARPDQAAVAAGGGRPDQAAVAAGGGRPDQAAVADGGGRPDQAAVAVAVEPSTLPGEPAIATVPSRPFGQELYALASRYARTLSRDRRTLVLLIVQAPVIGFLITIVFHAGALGSQGSPSNAVELVFMLMTASIWLGVASSCREVVKERGLVEREFDVGVRLDTYILAKALVLFTLVFVQIVLLTLVIIALQPLHVSASATTQVLMLAVLTGWASVGIGLAVSCLARGVDQAAGAVPLLLMPQLLLAGALIPLARMPRIVSALANITYARWSYAGIGSAAAVGDRLQATGAAAALGFDNNFFSLRSGAAAVILLGFTLVELAVATYFLRIRPPVEA